MSEPAAVTLYGIANCDTVRKARVWLGANDVDFAFHDFKKAGLSATLVERWTDALGWEALVNRKGTTWRNLPESRRAQVTDADAARALMLEFPSVVKRPVLDAAGLLTVGFSEELYCSLHDHRKS